MRILTALLIMAFAVLPASAHHGWGSYDADKPMTIEAPIDTIVLQDPHGELMLKLENAAWTVTLAPLSRMVSRGATEDIVKAGAKVKVYGYPRRDGTKEMRAEWIELDGKHFELR